MKRNKNIKKFSSVVAISAMLVITSATVTRAQYEPQFTQYLNNEQFINPAYAGSRGYAATSLLYRDQWVGIEGAPKTATFGFHSPFFNDKVGLGLCIMNDRIAVTNQTAVFLNYAYHLKATETGTLSLGLQGGIINVEEKLTDLIIIDPNDPEFSNNIPNKVMPNFGFGTYYHTDRWYAGFSIPRFLKNQIDPATLENVSNNVEPDEWHYFLYSAYVFDLGESIKGKPSLMVKAVQGAPVVADISMNVLFKELFWVGVSYRTADAVALLTQFQLTKQLRFGYSYDYSLTDLNQYSAGTHEFTIGYDFTFDKAKVVTPRYF